MVLNVPHRAAARAPPPVLRPARAAPLARRQIPIVQQVQARPEERLLRLSRHPLAVVAPMPAVRQTRVAALPPAAAAEAEAEAKAVAPRAAVPPPPVEERVQLVA